jgi:hypothetical protein
MLPTVSVGGLKNELLWLKKKLALTITKSALMQKAGNLLVLLYSSQVKRM